VQQTKSHSCLCFASLCVCRWSCMKTAFYLDAGSSTKDVPNFRMSFFESLSEEKLDQHMTDYELLHHCDHLTC